MAGDTRVTFRLADQMLEVLPIRIGEIDHPLALRHLGPSIPVSRGA